MQLSRGQDCDSRVHHTQILPRDKEAERNCVNAYRECRETKDYPACKSEYQQCLGLHYCEFKDGRSLDTRKWDLRDFYLAVEAEICNEEWKSCKIIENKEFELRTKISAIIAEPRENLPMDILRVIVEHVGTCQWNLEECVRKTKEMKVGEVSLDDVDW